MASTAQQARPTFTTVSDQRRPRSRTRAAGRTGSTGRLSRCAPARRREAQASASRAGPAGQLGRRWRGPARRSGCRWAAASSMAGWARSSCSASARRSSSSRSPASRLAQPLAVGRAVVAGEHEQHRQGPDALAQVGAGRLARLPRLAADVDEVVGELEGQADDLAEAGDGVDGRRRGAGHHRAEAGGGRDERAGLVGQHLQVVLDRRPGRRRARRSRRSGPRRAGRRCATAGGSPRCRGRP